jgi:2-aminoadipate transaminase
VDWNARFAKRMDNVKPSTIREILKLTQGSQVISFAGGLPAPDLFPIEALREASDRVLRTEGRKALQYSTTQGDRELRAWIAERHGTAPEQIQIVSGSQQGLDAVAKALLDPGDTVVVGAPTYMGALRAFDAYQVDYRTVPVDDDGLVVDELEPALAAGAKLLYTIPNFDNPSGARLSLERRERLVELCARYDVPIFEDDPYGELRFSGDPLPSLLELDPERVIHASTFSKILAPGLRLAWLVLPAPLIDPIERLKQAADLHTSTLTQVLTREVVQGGFMEGQIERVRAYYLGQRDAMMAALEAHFPTAARATRPDGGMFIWVTLPHGQDAAELLKAAVERKVAFVPGGPFFANGGGNHTLRLSYSVATREQIADGMARLGEVLERSLDAVPG